MMNPEVLIVGAGPVGLTLAAECRRQGVSFRIIDKAPGHSVYSKALAIWSGTLEHLAAAGLAEDFLEASRPVRKMVMQDMGHRVAEIPVRPRQLKRCATETLRPKTMLGFRFASEPALQRSVRIDAPVDNFLRLFGSISGSCVRSVYIPLCPPRQRKLSASSTKKPIVDSRR